MSPPLSSTADFDPVALAVANAEKDDRPVTEEEIALLREARADRRAFVSGAELTATLARRARSEG